MILRRCAAILAMLSACAHPAVTVVPAPASTLASQTESQPSSMPSDVVIPRERFNAFANVMIDKIAEKNRQIADLNKSVTIHTDGEKAANAKVDQQAFQLKLWAIIAPIVAAAVTAGGVVIGYAVK